jgi:glycosyltransferase involved in cell wall biosynthesis
MKSISFVIPAYNAAHTIAESVDSIFAGNFSLGDEVIIVNDASTDKTANFSETLKVRYAPHITILTNETNRGCPATRNVGIRVAKNELIFNLDADNILVSGMIEKVKSALLYEKADMAAFARYDYFVNNPKYITHYWHCQTGLFTLADLFAGHINPGSGGNFLYTKASWERIGGYSEYGKGLHEAWGFTLKQLAAGARMIVVPHTHYRHRHGHASLFATESRHRDEECALVWRMIEPYLDRFTDEDRTYIKHTPTWYQQLGKRPLRLKNAKLGYDGTMTRTWNGLYMRLLALLSL